MEGALSIKCMAPLEIALDSYEWDVPDKSSAFLAYGDDIQELQDHSFD